MPRRGHRRTDKAALIMMLLGWTGLYAMAVALLAALSMIGDCIPWTQVCEASKTSGFHAIVALGVLAYLPVTWLIFLRGWRNRRD